MPGRRVAIVGASTSDCGRVDDKTAFQLNFQGTASARRRRHRQVRGRRVHVAERHAAAGGAHRVSRPPARTGSTRPGMGAASGNSWSNTLSPPSPKDWSRSWCSPTARRSGQISRRGSAWRISRSGRGARSSSRRPSATRWAPTTPWWPAVTCTSSVRPWSSSRRWRCPLATTRASTPTPTTGTPSPSTTSWTRA